MAYYEDETVTLIENELTLYKVRNNTRSWWYAYVKIPNQPRIRRSMKTTSRRDAERKAKTLYFKLRSYAEEGLPLLDTSWSMLRKRFKESRHLGDTYKARLKMLDLYFGKYTNIKDITTDIIAVWVEWRKTFWMSKEGKAYLKKHKVKGGRHLYNEIGITTLEREARALRAILHFARDRGLLSYVPEIGLLRGLSRKRLVRARRAAFTSKEHGRICRYLDEQYKKALTLQVEGEPPRTQLLKNRRMHLWVHLLHKTGIRPGEAADLLWNNIGKRYDNENKTYILEIEITARKC